MSSHPSWRPEFDVTTQRREPLPSGAVVLECVMHQTELLDTKDRISNVDLRIETWAPTAGAAARRD